MEAPLIHVNTHRISEPDWPKQRAEIVMHPLSLQDAEEFAAEFETFLHGTGEQWRRFLSHDFVNNTLTNVNGMIDLSQNPDTVAWGVSEVVRESDSRTALSDEEVLDLAHTRELKGGTSLELAGCAMVLGLTPGGPHEVRQALFRTGRGIGTAVHLGRSACIFGQNELYMTARVFPGNVASERAVRQGFVERPVTQPAPVVLSAPGPDGQKELASPTHYVALQPGRLQEATAAFLAAEGVVPPTDPTPEFLHTLTTSPLAQRQMARSLRAARVNPGSCLSGNG